MAAQYRFLTEFELSSSPAAVEETLRDVGQWNTWWRWARRVESLTSDHGVVGARYRNRIATPLLYSFTYDTEVVEVSDELIRLEVSGDLAGTGVFRFRPTAPGGSLLSFEWSVETHKRWMNLLAPLAKSVFTWNHHKLMSDFGEGLGRASGGDLLVIRHVAATPT
ncbi:MAG: SRPBCC family protein [Acidimicrobiia bacterium]